MGLHVDKPDPGDIAVAPNTASPSPFLFTDITEEVRTHRLGFFLAGVITLALGIAAIAFPYVSTVAVEVLIGWIFVVSGVVSILQALRAANWRGFLWSLIGALLALGVGAILLLYPLTGVISLTLLMAAFFFAGGITRLVLAWQLRPKDHWGWLLLSGVLAVVLAVLIVLQWPEASVWIIGLFVGIDLVFTGSTLLMLAASARRPA
jgi:uncharacterized membrane protein HdeD (DUF308 family)